VILDTNALSAAAEEHPAITRRLSSADHLSVPVVVIGEYRYGISQSRHAASYGRWFNDFLRDCRVLDITEATTPYYAAIRMELRRSGKPIPTNNLWIAALCRQHHLPLLSQDRHFDAVEGLQRVAW
jgi:tRNA(fMet)-specific endonuclease VapC